MTETVTGHKMGVYLLYKEHISSTYMNSYEKIVIGVFTTLDNVKLAIEKLVKCGYKRNRLSYRLISKDELLIDLPSSLTDNSEDIYDF